MLSELFDLSFSRFITTRLIKLLYALLLAGAAIMSLVLGFGMISAASGFFGKLFGLALIPLVFMLSAIVARAYCEIIIVLFRIAENTREAADQLKAERQNVVA
jgi:uncharacterized membrane protein